MGTTRQPRASLPRRRTQAERTRETQAKLIDCAIEILKKRRYAGLRTADVADRAGVSKGAQTHHFPSKDKLVLQALEEVFMRTQRSALNRIEQARTSPAHMLDLLVADSQEFFLGDDFLLSLDLMMVDPNSELGAEVKLLAQRYRLPVEKAWLDALVEAGHPRPQALDVVRLTYAIARGFAVRQLIVSGRDPEINRLMKRWQHMASAMLLLSGSTVSASDSKESGNRSTRPAAKRRQKK